MTPAKSLRELSTTLRARGHSPLLCDLLDQADRTPRAIVVLSDPVMPSRSFEKQRLDEANTEISRGIYFNLAWDRALNHQRAASDIPGVTALAIQEQALRDAADMVASRIRVGLHKKAQGETGQTDQTTAPG